MPNLFPILLEVEEVAVGRVLRKLHALQGVANISLNLGKAPPAGPLLEGEQVQEVKALPQPVSQNMMRRDGRRFGPRNPKDNPVYQAIAAVLRYTPAHLKVLSLAAGKVVSVTPGSISSYMNRMQHFKLVRRTAPGTYALTEKAHKMYFGEATKRSASGKIKSWSRVRGGDNKSGFRGILLNTLKQALDTDPSGEGLMTGPELIPIIEGTGYSNKNLWSMGVKMANEGLVNIENGKFSITAAGVAALADAPFEVENVDIQKEGLNLNVS